MPAPLPGSSVIPSLAQRFGARVVDLVLSLVAVAAIAIALDGTVLSLVLGALASYAYYVGFDVLTGATPGKMLFGYRVHGADEPAVDVGAALRREAFIVVGAIPWVGPVAVLVLWGLIGWTISQSPIGIGWHDRLAMTHVARRAAVGS